MPCRPRPPRRSSSDRKPCRSRRPAAWPTCSARCRRRSRGSAGTSRSSMPRYRGVDGGAAASSAARSPSAASRATSAFFEAPLRTARARCSSTARSCSIARRCTVTARTTIPTTPGASPCSCAPRSSRGAARAPARRGARARLAGRPRARVPARRSTRPTRCSAASPSVFTIHNLAYQGLFEPDWLPRLDWRGICSRWTAGVLGPHQLPQGGHQPTPTRSRRSARATRARSRRRSSASASTASCAPRAPISSAS